MSRRPNPLRLAPLLLSLAGCQSAPPEPSRATFVASASPATAPPAVTAAEPANPAMGAPAVLADAHWKDFPGPKSKPRVAAASRAWGIRPVSDSFDSVTFALLNVQRVTDDAVVVGGYVPAHVPAAFVHPLEPAKGLDEGDAVVVDTAGAGPLGRVASVAERVLVKYLWHGRVAQVEVAPAHLLALAGKVAFAEPILYRSGANWKYARVAHAGGPELWIVDDGGKPRRLKAYEARPLNLRLRHRVGAAVSAVRMGTLERAEVLAVLGDGVAYEVRFESDGGRSVLSYDWVVEPR